MTKKRRRQRKPRGIGLGKGHKGHTDLSSIQPIPLRAIEKRMREIGQLEPDAAAYSLGECRIMVGSSPLGHHLSIAHPSRYPTWDEVAKARTELLPDEKNFGMMLPPKAEYVDVHTFCFHLWEVEGLKEARALECGRWYGARTRSPICGGSWWRC
jgi:hypothetical protein